MAAFLYVDNRTHRRIRLDMFTYKYSVGQSGWLLYQYRAIDCSRLGHGWLESRRAEEAGKKSPRIPEELTENDNNYE